jgi:hypothetical protein
LFIFADFPSQVPSSDGIGKIYKMLKLLTIHKSLPVPYSLSQLVFAAKITGRESALFWCIFLHAQ